MPGIAVAWVHLVAFIGAAGLTVLTAGSARWDLPRLLVIATFTVVSGITYAEVGGTRLRVSGSFLGIMLAAVLLGGGPAAIIAVVTILVAWLRAREAGHYLRNNVVTYAWFPLLGGLFFHWSVGALGVGPHDLAYYLTVFGVFVLALVINFVGIAGYQCYLDRSSILRKTHDVFAPVLPAELFSALLTMAAVYIAIGLGTIGIALFGLVLVIFQYLVGELLKSRQRAEELDRKATTDELTGLANREHFQARLAQQIEAASESGRAFGVILMDLDRFREINDTLGHHHGDVLLRELGPRLVACVGPQGLVARLGGDEFAVLPGSATSEPNSLEALAQAMLVRVQQPFLIEELSIELGASIGVSRYPSDGTDVHALIRHADVAMYAAKESHSGYARYRPEHDRNSLRRLSLLSDVRRALESDEIVVHYQPIVDLDQRQVRGAEALVRWQHPELGLIPPGSFVGVVEQTGLIHALTRRVLERAIAECAGWRTAGHGLSVAVNLSVRNLLDPGLPDDIEQLLRAHALPPGALQLEITESMLMSDPDRAVATVRRLSELGVRLSVDDFGTGYSSLANLRRLPIDELKIDRSFVSPMLSDESDLIIVRSTINLGHDLGLRIIAEGVEDGPTLERLATLGCDLAQGYHLSRPMAADAFTNWVGHTSQAYDRAA